MNAHLNQWLTSAAVPEALRSELAAIKDPKEIEDRFYRDLEFGTGGLRGKLGAGTNRLNLLTVGKATQGLAEYIREHGQSPSVCIAYDTRNMSHEFAQRAASVFCGNGVKAFLFDGVRPTPMLSFAVRHLKASAGIVITASHNPKEYNGYKVYGPDGGQITDAAAKAILGRIDACDLFTGIRSMPLEQAREQGLLQSIGEDVDAPYFEQVKALAMRKELLRNQADSLAILYSPLHGSGNLPVRRVLRELGFSKVSVVAEQELPDGNFPTAPYPNPEEPSVFRLAIGQAQREQPDLIFATDPDCDRIGVLVKRNSGDFSVLTGNQTGALLCDYILRTKRVLDEMPPDPVVVKTIVTSDFVVPMCRQASVDVVETLTGFKYIGELAERWSRDKSRSFLFGFEESYGYLAGDFVRDKDAVIAAALIAEMALYHKSRGKTLYQALCELFERYGHYADKLISIAMEGREGQQKISQILANLRENYAAILAGKDLRIFEDYLNSRRLFAQDGREEALGLPRSNVIKLIFAGGSWLVLRPSGTEPKIKIYLAASGETADQAQSRLDGLEALARQIML